MIRLLVDPKTNHYAWAIKRDGVVISRGSCGTLHAVRDLQIKSNINSEDVWIDMGYRTVEILFFCRSFRWNGVKGIWSTTCGMAEARFPGGNRLEETHHAKRDGALIVEEIEEATKDL